MSKACPCCGQALNTERLPVNALWHLPYAPSERFIIRALCDAYPATIEMTKLANGLFCGVKNGGAMSGNRMVHVYISRLRKSLKPHGWTINNCRGGHGNIGEYRLERFDGVTV